MAAHLIYKIRKGGAEIAALRSNMMGGIYLCISKDNDAELVRWYEEQYPNITIIYGFWGVFSFLRQNNNSDVICWMYRAIWIGSLFRIFFPHLRIIGNIRHTITDLSSESLLFKIEIGLIALLGRLSSHYVFNSKLSKDTHDSIVGQCSSSVIYNYMPYFERIAGDKCNILRVGFVGRNHPMKNLPLFMEIAKYFSSKDNIQFVVIGEGYQEICDSFPDNMHWVGSRDSTKEIFNEIDLLISCSTYGESFQNVVFEALLSGLPVISTRLAACGELLPDGLTVAISDNQSMKGQFIQKLINYHRRDEQVMSDINKSIMVAENVTSYTNYNDAWSGILTRID